MRKSRTMRRRVLVALLSATLLPVPAAAAAPTGGVPTVVSPEQDAVRERQDAVREQQRAAGTRLDETTAEISDLATRLAQATAAVAENTAALASAREQLSEAREAESQLASRLAVAQEVERNAVADVAATQEQRQVALIEVGRSAREAYVGARTTETVDILLGASGFDDFATRTDMLDRLGRLQGDAAAEAQLAGAVAESAQARRSAARDAVEQARAAAQSNVEQATAAEEAQGRLTEESQVLAAAEQSLLAEASLRRDEEMVRLDGLEQEASSLQAEMERLAREAAERAAREQAARDQAAREQAARDQAARDQATRDQAARDQAARDQATRDQAARDAAARDAATRDAATRDQAARDQAARDHAARDQAARDQAARDEAARRATRSAPPPPAAPAPAPRAEAPRPAPPGSGLVRPVTGRITSSYGWRVHPVYGTRRMHRGTDFGNSCGTPIRAAASGEVSSAAAAGAAGNRIILDHGVVGGRSVGTVYMHLERFAVRAGQSVDQGEVIGYVGTTGASTGCHLHFEVYENGNAVDPETRL